MENDSKDQHHNESSLVSFPLYQLKQVEEGSKNKWREYLRNEWEGQGEEKRRAQDLFLMHMKAEQVESK
jgi:hypothetical protein